MKSIKYVKFDDIEPEKFIPILNEESIRNHLIAHDFFDAQSISKWIKEKIACDAMSKCRVRAVYIDNVLAGWCGIQQDDADYEIAIVLSKASWGIGTSIFRDLVSWSKELGHKEILIHLLETCPAYKFLKRISTRVRRTKKFGRDFLTYHVPVQGIYLPKYIIKRH